MPQEKSKKITTLSDERLIYHIKKDNESAYVSELFSRYENIYYKVCNKYQSVFYICGIDINDVYEQKSHVFWNCIQNFDPSKKTKFSTWIGNSTRYSCLNMINSRKSLIHKTGDIDFTEIKTQKTQEQDFDFSCLHEYIGKIKDKKLIDIIKYRYLDGEKRTWKYISRKMNISVQTAISLHKKALGNLKIKIKTKDNI